MKLFLRAKPQQVKQEILAEISHAHLNVFRITSNFKSALKAHDKPQVVIALSKAVIASIRTVIDQAKNKCSPLILEQLITLFTKITKQRVLEIELKNFDRLNEDTFDQRINVYLNTGRSMYTIFSTSSKDIYDRIHVDKDYSGAYKAFLKEEDKLRGEIIAVNDKEAALRDNTKPDDPERRWWMFT